MLVRRTSLYLKPPYRLSDSNHITRHFPPLDLIRLPASATLYHRNDTLPLILSAARPLSPHHPPHQLGVGIVGKEGKQASLAADFSVTQFHHLAQLLLWHGRNSYRRSAKLAQFVIHRGLIISVMQAVFSAIFYFAPIALYQGWLMAGYATVYTMAPVFSLVLDRDVDEHLALLYPELYKELTKVKRKFLRFFCRKEGINVGLFFRGGRCRTRRSSSGL